MDTPSKSSRTGSLDDGALESTPFRERALQEQKLREELLFSETPGLQRRTPARHLETISRKPSEVKEYLRDLSSVLVSQGRNLTSFLTEQASIKDETESQADIEKPPDIKDELTQEAVVKKSSDPFGSASPEKPHHSIADTVFLQLETKRHKPKIRKIDDVVIKDIVKPAGLPESQADSLSDPKTPKEGGSSLSVPELPFQEELPIQDVLEESVQPRQVHEVIPGSDESSYSGEDLAPEEIEPLTITKLKLALGLFMNQNDIKFGPGAWRTLQDSSTKLMRELAKKFSQDGGRLVVDRQNLLNTLQLYEIIPFNASNEELFELCTKYLPLERLNELEMALFL
ncbi:CNN1 (YFR046C) [Zygosaccharomyces parabailii]|nr:CNN1 (YFR046C) [Zygosaccharomyces parabailii]CDH11822.1 uncharacterized protein ZBAI_03608 [Zygosaccharomyces bailii ISA1307]